MDIKEKSLQMHYDCKGKIEVVSRTKVENSDDLSVAYTPGVAQPCLVIKDEVIGYRFFDLVEESGERENVSPITYFGKRYTLEEMRFLYPEQTIIMANLEKNSLVAAVKTKHNFWMPLQPRDAVI